MQLTLGRRWVLTLDFSVRLARLQESCSQRATALVTATREKHAANLRWERDRHAARMLSGWHDRLL